MAEYTNSTPNLDDWELYLKSFTYSECLVILIILFYGLKIQLQKLSHQRNINLIKEFKSKVVHMLITLLDWCAFMQDYDGVVTSVVFESKDDPTQMTKAVIYNYILYYIQKTIHSKLICTNVHS